MNSEYERFLSQYSLSVKPKTVWAMYNVLIHLPPIDEITREDIIGIVSKKKAQNTRADWLSKIRVVLKHFDRLHLVEGISIKFQRVNITRSDLLTCEMISSLLLAATTSAQRALVEFLIESAARIGEALSLTKSDISVDGSLVIVVLDGKTGPREIPLLKDNLTHFLYHLATCSGRRVFPYNYPAILKQFKLLYRRAGIERPKLPFHIFRHSKITHMLEQGIPETFIKKFVGHSRRSNTLLDYTHLTSKSLIDYFKRLYNIETKPQDPLYPEDERERLRMMME